MKRSENFFFLFKGFALCMHVDEIDAFMIKKQLSDKMRNFSTTLQSSYCRLRISPVNGFRAEVRITILFKSPTVNLVFKTWN